MHYKEIAEGVIARELRQSVGATPADTVNSQITTDINKKGADSLFLRVKPGEYMLRESGGASSIAVDGTEPNSGELSDDQESTGIVEALGMYWARDRVDWKKTPVMLGKQEPKSKPVDFAGQRGVYLLHDGREVIYVGRSVDRPMGTRLYEHTLDRLNGRWDRFSWFGLLAVSEGGTLADAPSIQLNVPILIATMEAILIEALEPRQNRKRGDDFRAVEYIQEVSRSVMTKDAVFKLIGSMSS